MQLASQARKMLYIGLIIIFFHQLGKVNLPEYGVGWPRVKLVWQRLEIFLSDSKSAPKRDPSNSFSQIIGTQPLVMQGGDPYIRALMRTITASEANVAHPYNVVYGGQLVNDLSQHPGQCVAILVGPNRGNCSTAAGRYQMLDFTWQEKAQKYHPEPRGFWRWCSYSFEAQFQDEVVHSWLSDSSAWGNDISRLLQQGNIEQVLRLLSGTWTSLGYGIETNSMSHQLPLIYKKLLQEELG